MQEKFQSPVRFPGDTEPDTPHPAVNDAIEAARRQARQDPLLIRTP